MNTVLYSEPGYYTEYGVLLRDAATAASVAIYDSSELDAKERGLFMAWAACNSHVCNFDFALAVGQIKPRVFRDGPTGQCFLAFRSGLRFPCDLIEKGIDEDFEKWYQVSGYTKTRLMRVVGERYEHKWTRIQYAGFLGGRMVANGTLNLEY